MTLFALLVAIVPVGLVVVRRRMLVPLLATIAVAWPAASLALYGMLDSDDGFLVFIFLYVGLPALCVAAATIAATAVAPRPRKVFDAGFLAVCGWWLGLVVLWLLVITTPTQVGPFADCMIILALPAIYASAGAAFGATNKR